MAECLINPLKTHNSEQTYKQKHLKRFSKIIKKKTQTNFENLKIIQNFNPTVCSHTPSCELKSAF